MQSNDERGFLDHLREHPHDYDTMLVYADWLEENGRDPSLWRKRARGKVCWRCGEERITPPHKCRGREAYSRLSFDENLRRVPGAVRRVPR